MRKLGSGQTVVVARSQEGNRELQTRLSKLGIPTSAVDTITFEEPTDWSRVDEAMKEIGRFDWVAFTSPRAVVAFAARLARLGVAVKKPKPRVAAVGAKTEAALGAQGIETDFVPKQYLTSALGEGLPQGFGKRVLLLRTDIGERGLVESLARRGFDVTDLAIYYTRPVTGRVDSEGVRDARLVAFASPSEVTAFKNRLTPAAFRRVAGQATAACIGPVTAVRAREAGFKSVVSAENHTIEALVDKIGELIIHA